MIVNPTKIRISASLPKKLKWGVAFNKNFDVSSFLSVLQLLQRSKLVSVYSNSKIEAKEMAHKYGAVNVFDNFDDFLNSDINVIYYADNSNDFFQFASKILLGDKKLVCERPSSISYEHALELNNLALKNNSILIVNYPHRFHPLVQKVKELLAKQILGKIISISASYNIDFIPDESFYGKSKLSGSGALRDLGTQMIDLLRFFHGEIAEQKSFVDNIVYKSNVEDFVSSLLKFENGSYGNMTVSYLSKKSSNRIEIIGHNGTITLENIFDKKKAPSKLIIDLNGEGKKVFRKRVNKTSLMLRTSQKIFVKKGMSPVTFYDVLMNTKLIEDIEKQTKR